MNTIIIFFLYQSKRIYFAPSSPDVTEKHFLYQKQFTTYNTLLACCRRFSLTIVSCCIKLFTQRYCKGELSWLVLLPILILNSKLSLNKSWETNLGKHVYPIFLVLPKSINPKETSNTLQEMEMRHDYSYKYIFI